MLEIFEFDLVTAFNHTTQNISAVDFKGRNPNEFYEPADIAWMMVSSALVLLMIPGLGLLHSGISPRGSSLSMMWLSMMTTSVIGVQWYLWGYSIAFSGEGTIWGGSFGFAFHGDLTIPWGNKPGTKIPQLVYVLYQGMFACFTAAIVSGAVIHRGRPVHFLIFIFIWSTFVYDPIARASWNPVGWSNYWKGDHSGVFDFAGGTVVHISSATAAAVYSVFCSKWRRKIFKMKPLTEDEEGDLRWSEPHNVINVVLGTSLLWIGWFGFNGGSALGANLRAVSACLSTHLAACAGGVMGALLEYLATFEKSKPEGSTTEASVKSENRGKFSIVAFCNGVIAGLVAITPAAGYVPYWSAPIFGIASILVCSFCDSISEYFFDTHEIFVLHGVAGWVGMLLTAGLARPDVAILDGYTVIKNHHWEQLGIQVSDAFVGMAWSGVITFLILLIMEGIIVLYRRLRRIEAPEFKLINDTDVLCDDQLERNIGLSLVLPTAATAPVATDEALSGAPNGNGNGPGGPRRSHSSTAPSFKGIEMEAMSPKDETTNGPPQRQWTGISAAEGSSSRL